MEEKKHDALKGLDKGVKAVMMTLKQDNGPNRQACICKVYALRKESDVRYVMLRKQ
jgi:hypothetical protein